MQIVVEIEEERVMQKPSFLLIYGPSDQVAIFDVSLQRILVPMQKMDMRTPVRNYLTRELAQWLAARGMQRFTAVYSPEDVGLPFSLEERVQQEAPVSRKMIKTSRTK